MFGAEIEFDVEILRAAKLAALRMTVRGIEVPQKKRVLERRSKEAGARRSGRESGEREKAVRESNLKEAGANAIRDTVKVQDGEEIDGLELAVDGRGTAQARGDIEISAKEARGLRRIDDCAGRVTFVAGFWSCP